jgi:hypothetical protein
MRATGQGSMTEFAGRPGAHARFSRFATVASLIVAIVVASLIVPHRRAVAQSPPPAAQGVPVQQVPQSQPQPQAPPQPPPVIQAPPEPEHRPGFLERFGRWVDDSVTGVGRGFGLANGIGGQAVDAATTAAKGAANAATDTATAVTRLPISRVAAGSERCALAPNGAPDCKAAAEALCKAKGFTTGNSIDYVTAEKCPAQALLGRPVVPEDCTTEHIVTRALCQ